MLEKIYNKAPYLMKVVMLNIRAGLNYRARYTKDYHKYLNVYNKLWQAPIDECNFYQKKQLQELLLECYHYVEYYRVNFDKLKISEEVILKEPYIALKQLPLLSKMDRKKYVDKLVNKNPKRPMSEVGHTSGTSGSPTKNYLDKESIERNFALLSRFHKNIGFEHSERNVRFSGRLIVNPKLTKPPFWVYNKIEDQLFMSSYHLTESNCASYIAKLNQFRPKLLDGYPSAICVLARYINKHDLELTFQPIAIAVTAETLYDYQRFEIEKAFGCKVFNQYASSEGSPWITECTSGNLHVNIDSGVFEFLDKNNKPAKDGEIARMVVTSFRNYKTPLLRYDIEDTVLLPSGAYKCACGNNMPMVEKIVGREDDVLWTEEKGYIGRMDTAYKGLEGIVKSQIVQESPSSFVIYNIVDADFSEDMKKKFIKNLKDRLGENIVIDLKIVEDIPLGPNGKFDAVKRMFAIT